MLPSIFNVNFTDSDTECNQILNDYEEQLFFYPDESRFVKLAKTDVVGDWYSTIRVDEQLISYPKPFFFDVTPNKQHDNVVKRRNISRMICVYDNAGESFLPGADTVANPVTRHLGRAEGWLYCYDLTQDPRLRSALAGKTDDHQVTESPVTSRQEVILNEMINRIRRYSQLGRQGTTDKPLIVVCTKFDAMRSAMDMDNMPSPWLKTSKGKTVLDISTIKRVSNKIRKLLDKYCPELVAASDSVSKNVFFVPVSATGTSPEKDPETGDYMMRTDQLKPSWCEVPVMLMMALRAPSLIPAAVRKQESGE